MPHEKNGDAIRVMPAPAGETPPHPADRTGSGRRFGAIVGIVAGIAVILGMPWGTTLGPGPAPSEIPEAAVVAPVSVAADPASEVVVEPLTVTRRPPARSAEETLRAFVSSVDQGNVDAVKDLMSPELPDVLGLGTTDYPRFAGDAYLWVDGDLDNDSVAAFVHDASHEPESLYISDCASFADGPEVTIAACAYTVTGPFPLRSTTVETGRLFGFVVGGRIAGVVHRTS